MHLFHMDILKTDKVKKKIRELLEVNKLSSKNIYL